MIFSVPRFGWPGKEPLFELDSNKICNHATVIRLSYLRFIELLVAWEKSMKLDFFSPLESEANCNLQIKSAFN